LEASVWRRRPLAPACRFSGHTTTQPSSIEEEGAYPFDTSVDIAADFPIREADHAVALALQPLLALEISKRNVRQALVGAPVDLDH